MKVVISLELWKNGVFGSPNHNRSKLNFDGYRVQNISALRWVIKDSNSIIKMTVCKHIDNSSIIVTKYMTLRDVY